MDDKNEIKYIKVSNLLLSDIAFKKEKWIEADENEIKIKRQQIESLQSEIANLETIVETRKWEMLRIKSLQNDFGFPLKNNVKICEQESLLWKLVAEK